MKAVLLSCAVNTITEHFSGGSARGLYHVTQQLPSLISALHLWNNSK